MLLLRVSGLTVALGGRDVIHDLHFEVQEGERLAIIGPNGSGKTVLLKALLGILPYRGTIDWRKDVRIGYVPQKIEADRSIPITIRNLLDAKRRVMRVGQALSLSGQAESLPYIDVPIGQLSGGQFQRALIAFALVGDPEVLLFDEPTASIDERGEEETWRMLAQLAKTLIIVTHDRSFVERYADRALEMHR